MQLVRKPISQDWQLQLQALHSTVDQTAANINRASRFQTMTLQQPSSHTLPSARNTIQVLHPLPNTPLKSVPSISNASVTDPLSRLLSKRRHVILHWSPIAGLQKPIQTNSMAPLPIRIATLSSQLRRLAARNLSRDDLIRSSLVNRVRRSPPRERNLFRCRLD